MILEINTKHIDATYDFAPPLIVLLAPLWGRWPVGPEGGAGTNQLIRFAPKPGPPHEGKGE